MNKTKRVIAILLTLAMFFTIMHPEAAFANTEYIYKPTRETRYLSSDGNNWVKDIVTTWAYNDKGLITRERHIYYDLETGEEWGNHLTRYIYNEDGTLKAKKVYEDGVYIEKTRYAYNEKKQLIRETYQVIDKEAVPFYKDYIKKYEYNSEGQLIYIKRYVDGKLDYLKKYKYENGNLVRETSFDGNRKPTYLHKYTDYDSNGNCLRHVEYDYDENGKAVLMSVEKYKYNSKNQEILHKWYEKGKYLYYGGTCEYNERGDLIRVNGFVYTPDIEYEYEYDKNGNLKEKIIYDHEGEDYPYTKYVYNNYKKIAVEE